MQATFPYLAEWVSMRFWIEGQALDTEMGITGAQSVVPTMRGRWRAQGEVMIHGREAFLQWQAFLAQMQGVIGTALVPVPVHYGPQDLNGRDLPFDRTAGIYRAETWEMFGFEGDQVSRTVTQRAEPLRATELIVQFTGTLGLRPGQWFSIGDHLYQVRAYYQPNATNHRILFNPPLRKAVPVGSLIEIERPTCRMRFASEDSGQFAQRGGDLAPVITVDFVEDI